jgi:hypothetical protein
MPVAARPRWWVVTSAASVGGAAGAAGVGLQNRVFGWAAAAMVAEQALLEPSVVAGVVARVGAQTGFFVDDVAVQTDADNYGLFQVKSGLTLGAAENSPLAKALGQVVDQYLKGRLPTKDGTERRVDPARDALVICTNNTAPATVREHLAAAISRTGSQPPGTPLGRELTNPQQKALNVALAHVRRQWEAIEGTEPTDEQLRRLLRALRVTTVDANEGEQNHAAAVATMAAALADPAAAAAAWPVLVAEGQAASVTREWRDRAGLGLALSRHEVWLSPPARYAPAVATLRDVSAANQATLAREALLPVAGGLHIPRTVGVILVANAAHENILIVGDAGAGKSSVAQELAAARAESQQVVVLRAADIAGANRLMLGAPLGIVLRSWYGPSGLLLIDGVDALRGADDRAFLSGVVADLQGSRWQIVATSRSFDARNNHELQQAFAGRPLADDPALADGTLHGVRHLLVGDLTDEELETAVKPPLPLAALLAEASPDLRALLRNPFNLRLAAALTESGGQLSELHAVRSRVGLLQAYWDRRVHSEASAARDVLLARLCREMVTRRDLRVVEGEPVVTAADSAAVTAMLSEHVLSDADAVLPTGRRVLSFSHNVLFDYAVAVYLLLDPLDPTRLVPVLDADPSLPLVARPSLEILVDVLWERRETGLFWPVCLGVAESSHVLASLAVAARLLRLVQSFDDLAPLAPPAGRADRTEGLWPEQELTRQLTGALSTPAVLADGAAVAAPLATLARHLAENAAASYADAALATNLLDALQRRVPVAEGQAGADDRGRAVAELLDACRTDPRRMEQLAGAAARQLPDVVASSAAAREAVYRLLDDDATLQQWGGTVLTGLAEAVVPVVSLDSDLAKRLATTILTFNETRDEQVAFSGSVLLAMSESRRQQAALAVYILGEAFDELCAADLLTAAEIFCTIAENGSERPSRVDWPVTVAGAEGWLRYGQDLSLTEHDVGTAAARALSVALAAADPAGAQPVIALLVKQLHNAAAWAAIMTPTGEPVALGKNLLPAIESGALLVHPRSHAAAAGLLRALANSEPALAGRLEQAVLRAHALADTNGVSERVKDALIGCLQRDSIASPALISRLDELGPDAVPDVEPYMRGMSWSRRWSDVDSLGADGTDLDPTVASAARVLDEQVQLATGSASDQPERERRLPEAFTEADAAFASIDALPPTLALLLVRAAEVLAYDRSVVPGTVLGDRVLAILTAAADSPEVGTLNE